MQQLQIMVHSYFSSKAMQFSVRYASSSAREWGFSITTQVLIMLEHMFCRWTVCESRMRVTQGQSQFFLMRILSRTSSWWWGEQEKISSSWVLWSRVLRGRVDLRAARPCWVSGEGRLPSAPIVRIKLIRWLFITYNEQSPVRFIKLFRTPSNMKIWLLLCFAPLLHIASSFSFKELIVSSDNTVIGETAQYTFIYQRYFNNSGSLTPYNTQAVSSSAIISLTFPTDYTFPSNPTCVSLTISSTAATGYSCSFASPTLTVTGAFASVSNLYVYDVELVVGNILNPTPAITTGEFSGVIGTDIAVPNGGAVMALSPAAFDSCSITFDGTTVNQTSTMVLTLDPKNSLTTSSFVVITLPNTRKWANDISSSNLPLYSSMTCKNYSAGVSSAPACSGDLTAYSITATGLLTASTSASFSFGVVNFRSPPSLQPSDAITITSWTGSSKVDTCTAYVSGLTANSLTSFTITPTSTFYVNSQVPLSFNMAVPDYFNSYDDIRITFPSTITLVYSLAITKYQIDSTLTSVSGQTVTIYQRRVSISPYSPGSTYFLTLNSVKAPPSTETTGSITFEFIRNGYGKMVGTATLTAVANTLTGSVTPTVKTVWASTTYVFSIVLGDALSSAGMIKITFPSSIVPTAATSCATLVGTGVVTNPTCAYDSSSRVVTISAMNSSSSTIAAQTLQVTVLSVQNAPSIAPSGSFSVSSYYSSSTSSLVASGTIAGVTATVGTIDNTQALVTPSSYVVLATSVTYTIQFKNTYQIPQGGFIQITIPSGISMDVGSASSYCKLSLNSGSFSSTTCQAASGASYFVNFTSVASSAIAAASTIALRIQQVFTNPTDTGVVSSFTIATYSSDSYKIQQATTGISVQMTTPATMTSMAVTRVGNTNSQTGVPYTIRLKQQPSLSAGSILTVTFPTDIELTSSSACTDLLGTSIGCTIASNVVTVTLGSSYSSLSEFGVIVSNAINPPSFAALNSNFQFATKSSTGLVSYATGSLQSTLLNTVPSSFGAIAFSFTPRIYGQTTSLDLTITPSSRIVPSYLIITLASSFTVPTALTCTSWSCTSLATHQIQLNGATAAEMSITINGFTAPTSVQTAYSKVSSYTAAGAKIDESTSLIIFSVECVLPCRTCLTTNTSACQTCYTSTSITTFNYLYDAGDLCYEVCPSGTYQNDALLKCFDCNSICLQCSLTASNCTDCDQTSAYPYLYLGDCKSACPTTMYPDTTTQPVECVLCVSPCATCSQLDVCLSCVDGFYFYEGECINPCPTGITIVNDVTNQCDLCNSVCAQCVGSVSNCSDCSSTSVRDLAADGSFTCVSICPSPKVNNSGICSYCSSSCLTCSINYDNCTSCNTSTSLPYLYSQKCLGDCPELYYENIADGLCILCSTLNIGCANCTSTSTCGTCDSGYIFYQSRCLTEAPPGYYNNTGYAQACDAAADCATCTILAYNCTSCISKALEGNDCVDTCTPGYINVNSICTICTSPCKTCSGLVTNCTSCDPTLTPEVFLSNYKCTATCPTYTYANQTLHQCTACVEPCEKCISASECTSCLSGYFLQDSSCGTGCDFGYLGINRICEPCTPPCESCSLTLTHCLTCDDGYYFISSLNECDTVCPTDLYPNDLTQTCTGCTSPCDTCTGTSSTCTSCLTGFLSGTECVDSCLDGYYAFNGECIACSTGCATCSSGSVCLTCNITYYFYSNKCLTSCPTSHPVIVDDACQVCSDTNCITCSSSDQCQSCSYPFILFSGKCLATCPANYTENVTDTGTTCYYDPPEDTTTSTTLENTLSSSNIFPVPFTIGAIFIAIACLMSKFQHPSTFIYGSLFSLVSLLEWAALMTAVYFYLKVNPGITLTIDYVEAFIFAGGIVILYLLNFLALCIQGCFLKNDFMFQRWLDKQTPNSCCYCFSSGVGVICTHKFKNIMFCKLFGFDTFKAKLQDVQNFKIFNIFAFLSFLSSAAVLLGVGITLYEYRVVDQALMAYIDVAVLTVVCIILAILNSRKGTDFFEEKDDDGIVMHKRIRDFDSIMQDAIVPMIAEEEEVGGNIGAAKYDTDRRFKSFEETLSDASEMTLPKAMPKTMMNISIQAAPVLQDYSNIDFYNDEEVSQFSMFRKVDRSINMTHELNHNDVSIQNEPNIFDQREVSVQNNPFHEDASVQDVIDMRDISLQNVANQDEQGVQMSRREEDHSIQAAVFQNNASVQYSAKPNFENISQDMIDSEDEPNLDQTDELYHESRSQKPAVRDGGLQKELEMDVDEKVRQRQDAEEEELALRREQEKEQMLKNFHREQQRKLQSELQREAPSKREDEFHKVNRMYNNDSSGIDSSIMSSNAEVMINFKGKKKNEEEKGKGAPERMLSAQTEKEFIEMLSKKEEEGLDPDSSLSFNVTRDLDAQNDRRKGVVFQEEDKAMGSEPEEDMDEDHNKRPHQVYILPQQDSNEELPSGLEKSRSTNFLSTARRPPRQFSNAPEPHLIDSSNMDDIDESGRADEDEEINNRPIGFRNRNNKPANYRYEDINYEPRTNLTHFVERRNRNSISAQLGDRRAPVDLTSEDLSPSKKQMRHKPLPPPKVERLPSLQADPNESREMYRGSNKKGLMETKKLEFDDAERIDLEQQQIERQLPRVLRSETRLKKSNSISKISEKGEGQKAVHREILGRDKSIYERTDKYLQKEQKRVEETRRRIDEMNVMLERPGASGEKKSYLEPTYSSKEKNKRSAMEKVYMNNPFDKKL